MKDIDLYKVISVIVVFIISYAVAIFPILNKKFRSSPVILGLANSFSGGLFLAAGLVHILPEAAENANDYFTKLNKGKVVKDVFPWVFFAATLSFSVV